MNSFILCSEVFSITEILIVLLPLLEGGQGKKVPFSVNPSPKAGFKLKWTGSIFDYICIYIYIYIYIYYIYIYIYIYLPVSLHTLHKL